MRRARHIPWYQHGCTGRNQILLGGIFSYQLQCLKNSGACEQNYCQNTGLNSNWKYSVPNQVEYFHSCPSSGDHCGCQGRALCGASSAQLWKWCVASHCTKISMPEEGMASIKYNICYLGAAWRTIFPQIVFTFSISGISCSNTCLNWPSLTPSLWLKEVEEIVNWLGVVIRREQLKDLTCRR